ncbi:MAG: 4-hydroxy-tetrahydrodipicolinate synthase [Oscillospiraceae bacterium]|nr:4-hydroxy-tetrahydrodipicolinate synthase [Oscillospiraceae bacterium]
MKTPVFTGSCTALVTPFTEDSVDLVKLGELIDTQIQAGISALVICGTTGEASTQSIDEHKQTVDYAVKRAAGRVPVIAGTGANCTAEALELSQAAERSGADALLVVTPYYNRCSQTGLIKHFTYIADRVSIPVILYNVPSRTSLSFNQNTYYELSKHERINGVKEASGDFSLIARTRCLCGDELNIWSGNDGDTIPIMSLGGKGVISTSGNVIPKEITDMCKLFAAGKIEDSVNLFLKYLPLMDALFIDVNPIPVKTALSLMGRCSGRLRMPLCEMDAAKTEKLKAVMKDTGLL